MNTESLKEYLVKIGWKVDNNSLSKSKDSISKFSKDVSSLAKGIGSNFLSATKTVGNFAVEIIKSSAKIAASVANADLEVERFARKMWVSEQSARSLTTALNALDMSYEDLFYATDEQYNRFLQLNNLGKMLEAPKEADETLRKIRDIQFELSKLKQALQYGYRWVAYYFGKMFGKDLDEARSKIKSGVNFIIKNIPTISKKVSEFLWSVYRVAKTIFNIGKGIYTVLKNTFDSIGIDGVRNIALLSAAFLAILNGPLGLMIAGISALILLMDDFFAWKEGRRSFFGDRWEKFDNLLKRIKGETGEESGFSKLAKSASDLLDTLKDLFGINDDGSGDAFINFITLLTDSFDRLLGVIADVVNFLNLFIKGLNPDNWDDHWLGDWFKSTEAYKIISNQVSNGGNFEGLGLASMRHYGEVGYSGTSNNDNSVTNNTQITVNMGSNSDPYAVGTAVSDAISRNRYWRNQ